MSSLICLHLLLCSGAFFVPLKRIVVDLAIRLPFPLSAYWGHTTTTPLYDDDDDDALATMDYLMADLMTILSTRVFWDDSRAHVRLRWKTTKRAISFTVPETFCKTDVREYNTLFTLSELLFWISLYTKYPTYRPPSKYTFSTFLFSPRCFKITHTAPQLLSKKQVTFFFNLRFCCLKVVWSIYLITHIYTRLLGVDTVYKTSK